MPQSVIAAKSHLRHPACLNGTPDRRHSSVKLVAIIVPCLSRPHRCRARLDASAFPADTPLNAFFAWNEARYLRDRRYVIARDIHRLLQKFEGETEVCLAHLACRPIIRWRFGRRIGVSPTSRPRGSRARRAMPAFAQLWRPRAASSIR